MYDEQGRTLHKPLESEEGLSRCLEKWREHSNVLLLFLNHIWSDDRMFG